MSVEGIAEGLLRQYDTNRDGVLQPEEWRNMPATLLPRGVKPGQEISRGEMSRNRVYKIDTNVPDVEALKRILVGVFRRGDDELLARYSMDWKKQRVTVEGESGSKAPGRASSPAPAAGSKEGQEKAAEKKAAEGGTEKASKQAKPAGKEAPQQAPSGKGAQDAGRSPRTDLPSETLLALADSPGNLPAPTADGRRSQAEKAPGGEAQKAAGKKPGASASAEGFVRYTANLSFAYGINAPTLRDELEVTAKKLAVPALEIDLVNSQWDGRSNKAYSDWTVTFLSTERGAEAILNRLKGNLTSQTVWPSSSKIGPQVAGDTQKLAIVALIFSWLGIIVYVWVRFQRVVFGVAGVVALVHDVLVTVAAVAVSAWLARTKIFGLLLVDEFRIDLSMIAALLTIIGYSINDTIVIFDRIREVRGRSPELTRDMINLSVNQTLSRTLLTAWTVFMVVLILYAFGGEGIHGFAFAMLVGTVVGCYSSVYIAAPIVLWMLGSPKSAKKKPLAA
jgi:SecD/SecF fusion protein